MRIHIPDFEYTIYDDEYTVTVADCFINKPDMRADNPWDYYGDFDSDWTLVDNNGNTVTFPISDHDHAQIESMIYETAHSILYEN